MEQRDGAVGEMTMLRNSTEATSLVQLEMKLRDVAIATNANREETSEIATAAVRQAEMRSEGLQMELNQTFRELKDSRTGFGKDRELIATLPRDGRVCNLSVNLPMIGMGRQFGTVASHDS